MAVEKAEQPKEELESIQVIRPKRAVLSEQEVLKRMQEFAEHRKDKLIASVRKNKRF